MSVKGREIRKMSWELILGSVSASATGFQRDRIISCVTSIEISRRIQTLIAQNECENNAVLPHYLFSLSHTSGQTGTISQNMFVKGTLMCLYSVLDVVWRLENTLQ